jgi:hypothetical protein
MSGIGTTEIDFGAFPGKSDASLDITGETGILSTSAVEAWLIPTDTTDHTADEHLIETIKVVAGWIVEGTGFTIKAFNTNMITEPLERERGRGPTYQSANPTLAGQLQSAQGLQTPLTGGAGTRIWGKWKVGWVWF